MNGTTRMLGVALAILGFTASVSMADAAAPAAAPAAAEVGNQRDCPVTGNPIDENVFVVYQGQKIYFCCPGCDETFLKTPETYFDGFAESGVLVASVQTVCAVSGERLPDKNTYVDHRGRRIYFCCPGCDVDFLKEPGKYLPGIK
ncbi:YHS domain-containing protein [bacterium]|nr:YHS domain-containing protein [bacterium]MBU1073211.1 YHS domain-containing protein [bacterium]MBU1676957.1 YHS domain-containing protein [bacterium]